MTCNHYGPGHWEEEILKDFDTGEVFSTRAKWVRGPSLDEDISIGAFKCRGCGRVGYYTGTWKEFYEHGKNGSCTSFADPKETAKVRAAIKIGRARS
jgi:hypothetical protein